MQLTWVILRGARPTSLTLYLGRPIVSSRSQWLCVYIECYSKTFHKVFTSSSLRSMTCDELSKCVLFDMRATSLLLPWHLYVFRETLL